jgi:hypothetical protein
MSKFKVGDVVRRKNRSIFTNGAKEMKIVGIENTHYGTRYRLESGTYFSEVENYEVVTHAYKVGDKVVPHSKSAGYGELQGSCHYKEAMSKGQPYLYVRRIDGSTLSLTVGEKHFGGDFFLTSDVTPYEERMIPLDQYRKLEEVSKDKDKAIATLDKELEFFKEKSKKDEKLIETLLEVIKNH